MLGRLVFGWRHDENTLLTFSFQFNVTPHLVPGLHRSNGQVIATEDHTFTF
jgi:hypothetical protein